MSLQVIGVGLHRTGSLSVKVALERLGFGPCYHGFEFVGRPDQRAAWQEAFDRDGTSTGADSSTSTGPRSTGR